MLPYGNRRVRFLVSGFQGLSYTASGFGKSAAPRTLACGNHVNALKSFCITPKYMAKRSTAKLAQLWTLFFCCEQSFQIPLTAHHPHNLHTIQLDSVEDDITIQ